MPRVSQTTAQVVHDDLGRAGVQGGDRLVAQDHVQLLHEGAGDADAGCFLSDGKPIAALVGLVGEAEHLESSSARAASPRALAGDASAAHWGLVAQAAVEHVFDDVGWSGRGCSARCRPEFGSAALEAALHGARRTSTSLGPPAVASSLRCIDHAIDAAEERGLASPRTADDGHEFTFLNVQGPRRRGRLRPYISLSVS